MTGSDQYSVPICVRLLRDRDGTWAHTGDVARMLTDMADQMVEDHPYAAQALAQMATRIDELADPQWPRRDRQDGRT